MRASSSDSPLGVFDSGLGGLTVVRALRELLPQESILYLGDTARVPYGTKSPETVTRYALSCARFLLERGAKAIVVACNTVSAVALDMLRAELDCPVLGVIEPGARAAVAAAGDQRCVGVLGTRGTILSGAYTRAIGSVTSRIEVVSRPAPLFVPLVEEGWLEGQVPRLVARSYLEPLVGAGVRVVLLGCTHYPLLAEVIREEAAELAGEPVTVVDSAQTTALAVRDFLQERGMLALRQERGTLSLMVTDVPNAFEAVAARFLGEPLPPVERVSLP